MTTRASIASLCDQDAIRTALKLFLPAGQVTELRALDAAMAGVRHPSTLSGYFDDPEVLVATIAKIERAKGIYFLPNVVDPALLARAANRLRKAGQGDTTADSNVIHRNWLLVDADSVRPSGISATDDEHEAARQRTSEVQAYLSQQGWPDPIFADSGNGYHLLYRIDLPADDGGLVARCLQALADRFTDGQVKVDTTVGNPARIWKLYGTRACKGDSTPERPHRMSRILSAPETLEVVPTELLEQLAAETAQPALDSPSINHHSRIDVYEFIRHHSFDVTEPVRRPSQFNGQSGLWWEFNTSPLCDHHDRAAYLAQLDDGTLIAGCHHNSCSWRWQDLRRQYPIPGRGTLESNHNGRIRDGVHSAGCRATQSIDSAEVDLPQEAKWPNPLQTEAFYGLAGAIVRAIEPHTEADPVAVLIQVLVAFGNVTGRKSHFRAEADRHYLNVYATLVGETSKGRKGTSWGHVHRIFNAVDHEWAESRVLSGLSSGEGLIWHVRDPIFKRQPVYEGKGKARRVVDYEDVEADKGVPDKRLLVLESEFAHVLRVLNRESNTLSPVIRNAWDRGNLQTLTKNSPAKATGAHVSIVGHITRDELRRYLTDTEAGNGFGNRFLWLCVRRSKCLPEGGRIQEGDLGLFANRLDEAVQFARGIGQLHRDETAREIWMQVYPSLSEGKTGLLGAMISRAEAQVVRLASIYALLDLSDVIRCEHLLAAIALWDYCEQSARYIFGALLGDPIADEILASLKRSPAGVSRTEISGLFGRHAPAARIQQALRTLADQNLAYCAMEETQGRSAKRWYANNGT